MASMKTTNNNLNSSITDDDDEDDDDDDVLNTNNTHFGPQPPPQACAACKHQRRKCVPDCMLAPFFPHYRHQEFLNAHRLFGVSNIIKIIRHMSLPDRRIAMRTIMYQSDARAADPVGGCLQIVHNLHHRIQLATAELRLVLQYLNHFRAQAAAAAAAHNNNEQLVIDVENDGMEKREQEGFDQHDYKHHLQNLSSWLMQDSVVTAPPIMPSSSSSSLHCADDHANAAPPLAEISCGGERSTNNNDVTFQREDKGKNIVDPASHKYEDGQTIDMCNEGRTHTWQRNNP
ncbi:LOB domain-containing protein 7-like [Malania oleifera]|uniref:LOB domain-containing protein 7-like n=1 Tax=Malania oleifera TaxID=397392 RepID=UPI0025AE3C7C|nr:LOB domain-containing protein 7-like [Malania oleifera]